MFYNVVDEGYDLSNTASTSGYSSTDDMARMLYEAQQNDYALFEAMIMSDFREVNGRVHGTLSESEIRSLQENVFEDAWKKLKELLAKFWAKIKAIFNKFLVFITSVFVKDGKTLHKKYKDAIGSKDLSDLEVDWVDIKEKATDKIVGDAVTAIKTAINSYSGGNKAAIVNKETSYTERFWVLVKKDITGLNISEDTTLGDIKEYFIPDSEKVDFKSVQRVVEDNLLTGKKAVSDLKKSNAEIEKNLKKLKKIIDDGEKASDEADQAQLDINYKTAKTGFDIASKIINMCMSVDIDAQKIMLKQSKKAWLKAASYTPKTEAVDLAGIDEAVEFEFDTDYDTFCLNY